LPAFDSSIGADEWHLGYKSRAVALLIMMLVISLLTKAAAVFGLFGTEWPERHLIWALLTGLSLPHLIALAHPSYFQMFMNVAIPVIAVSVAKVEPDCLKISYRAVAVIV